MEQTKRYLGDGVYAWSDGFQVWLETQCVEGRHLIALEPSMLDKLQLLASEWMKTGALYGGR